jgi:hypothetical protein
MDADQSEKILEEQRFAFGEALVGELAPEESDLYAELIAAYRSKRGSKKGDDHPLALGVNEIVAAASPALFEAGSVVVACLWEVAKGTTEKSLEMALAPQLTSWIKRKFEKPAPFKLSQGQVDTIVETVEAKVARMRIPPEMKASLVSVANCKIVRQNRHFQRSSAANFACRREARCLSFEDDSPPRRAACRCRPLLDGQRSGWPSAGGSRLAELSRGAGDGAADELCGSRTAAAGRAA